jgi:hypothetical protein
VRVRAAGVGRWSRAAWVAALLAGAAGWVHAENVPAMRARVDSLGRPPTPTVLVGRRGRMPVVQPAGHPLPPRPDSLKIHPLLRTAIHLRPGDTDTVLVTFQDPLVRDATLMRRVLGPDHPRGRPTPAQLRALSDSLTARRTPLYRSMADTLRSYGATVLPPRFRLTQSLLITIRLGVLDSLSRNPSVIHIDPLHGGPPPTPCGSNQMNAQNASAAMAMSHYLSLRGSETGTIALFDTGILRSHSLLSAHNGFPSPIVGLFKCSGINIEGDPDQEDVQTEGHGTASAALLAGNASMGNQYRGLTSATIDSYAVFDPPGEDGGKPRVNYHCVPNAFDHAVLDRHHDLLDAEIAEGAGYGDMTNATYWAYTSGAMVIAANGNDHDGTQADVIPQPAVSPLCIGVGSYCIFDEELENSTTRGQTPDGRVKPDVGGLSSIYTAANGKDDAMNNYPGTSGAAPSVAAAALLLANWMGGGSFVEPGQVYSMLVLCGTGGRVDPTLGAGLIHMPADGAFLWHWTDIRAGDSLEIEIPQDGMAFSQVDAAIWWPELGQSDGGGPSAAERAWVALRLDDSKRTVFARSDLAGSVFQRATLRTSQRNPERPWFLTLLGNWIPQGETRTVYWTTWGRRK